MFQRENKKEEAAFEEKYLQALKGKRVPLLTLDPRWHQLFPEGTKPKKLSQLEKELNRLIKKQGQTNNDLKDYEKACKVITQNVLANMTDGNEADAPLRSKKQDKNQKLLDELKNKIKEAEEIQEKIPEEIKQANNELLIESMRICYDTLLKNTEEIKEEAAWILATRKELTEHILVKRDKELQNQETYRYMHDLLGAEIVEIFDRDHEIIKGEDEE